MGGKEKDVCVNGTLGTGCKKEQNVCGATPPFVCLVVQLPKLHENCRPQVYAKNFS